MLCLLIIRVSFRYDLDEPSRLSLREGCLFSCGLSLVNGATSPLCPQSFFDGWDCTKKKDKTKGRHDTLLGCESSGRALSRPSQSRRCPTALSSSHVSDDRHRVKLHPLLGDPNSDYINANYIDVSPVPRFPSLRCLSHTPS